MLPKHNIRGDKMRFEYALLGIVAMFAFVLLVSAAYPDSMTANAAIQGLSKGKAVAVNPQPVVNMEEGSAIINRQIFSDIAGLQHDVSALSSRFGTVETCCQETRQGIRTLESRLAQLEQRVTQQEQAGGQEAQSTADMFGQCQVLGTGVTGDNCNAVCAGLRKTCVAALHEGVHRAGTKEYSLASCSESAYRNDQWTVRFTCQCC